MADEPENPIDEVLPEPVKEQADEATEIPPWGKELQASVEELKGHTHEPAHEPEPEHHEPEPEHHEPEPEQVHDEGPSKPPWTHRSPFPRKHD